jgi:hypothetical protein
MASSIEKNKRRSAELFAVTIFVAVNLLAPLVVGEMYPFTISPMFCDQPGQYCTYQLIDENGSELSAEEFGLHLVYDGNPPGLGMGIEAAPRMHEFGVVPAIEEVVAHVKEVASAKDPGFRCVTIRQTVVCCNGTCPEASVHEAKVEFEPQPEPTE